MKGYVMNEHDLKFINDMHDIVDTLEKYDLHEEAEILMRKNSYVFSWDRNGKWIGDMKNENGWTDA